MPRSVTSTNGSSASRSRPATLVAESGSHASSTRKAAEVKCPARMRLTSSSSSARRSVRQGPGAGGGAATRAAGEIVASGSSCGGDGPAGGAAGVAAGSGATAGAGDGATAGGARALGRGGEARPRGEVASGSCGSVTERSRANAVAGTIGSSPTTPSSGAANEASTAAAECARSSSIPWAISSSSSCGLVPAARVSRRMSRGPTVAGIASLSSNANAPSRRRASCSRANTMRARTARSRASRGSAPSRGSGGGDPAVNAATTRPSWNTIAPSPPSIAMAR
jgi:hypothetical protein